MAKKTKAQKAQKDQARVVPDVFDAQKALVVAMLNAAKNEIYSCIDAAIATAEKGDFAAVTLSMNTIKIAAQKVNEEAYRFDNNVDVDVEDDEEERRPKKSKKSWTVDEDDE